jgi:UDP-GlcNAc:undecaprenyl-phosphate/decaprenyl-phosphate GlcNAc-1-phosphate transferase
VLSSLLSFGAALVLVYLLTPLVIRGAHQAGVLDVPIDQRRAHKIPTPRLGGVAVFVAISLTWIGISVAQGSPWNPFGEPYGDLIIGFGIGAGAIFLSGLVDDIRGLTPHLKLSVQIGATLAAVAYGLTPSAVAFVPGGSVWHAGEIAGTCIFVLWTVGTTNAFNLIDGLDGLASAFALIALGVILASIAILQTRVSMTFPVIFAGALFGFLRYNWNPARIFLGDAGSMTLGFTLAVVSVLVATDANGVTYPIIPLLALAFPITDTLIAIGRRWVRGISFSVADDRHIHHQLRASGLTVVQTVRALVLIFSLIAVLGMTVIFAPPRFTVAVLLGGVPVAVAAVLYGVRLLQYDEFVELANSAISVFRSARQIVQIKIHANEAVSRVQKATSIEEVREILNWLAEQTGLLDIELIEPGQKESLTPPSQQIARANALPMRLDYSFAWSDETLKERVILRVWRSMDLEASHVMERVIVRLGPAVTLWFSTHYRNSCEIPHPSLGRTPMDA